MTRKTKAKPAPKPEPIEHGVEEAHYNNLPTQHPEMVCLCGYYTVGAESWEDAGAQMDEHIEEET